MKDNIFKIANSLVMMENSIPANGLLKGKMGIAIFLYHSSRTTGDKVYSDIADQLIDEILDSLNSNMDLSFSNGLSGIGFGLAHLIKHKFIDADPNDFFIDIDDKIFPKAEQWCTKDLMDEIPLFSFGLYLLERIKSQGIQSDLEIQATKGIEICKKTFERKLQLNYQSVMYFNSAIYFLITLKEIGYSNNQIDPLIDKGLNLLKDSLAETSNCDCDFHITQQLISSLDISELLKQDILQQLNASTNKVDDNIIIDHLWQTMLYFPEYKFETTHEDIDTWIDERLDALLDYEQSILSKELLIKGLSMLKN